MVTMAVERVAETVLLTTRPSYQASSVYTLVDVDGQRRHKQEIKLLPTLKPVKYADTAFLMLNNTRRRFRSRTYYQPRMNQTSFADTTYATPKTTQERFVSSLDLHSDQLKKKFTTSIEIKPRNFKSSVSFPNIESLSSSTSGSSGGRVPSGFSHGDAMMYDGNDVDENMNQLVPPVFQEKYDPGASQVFIPERKNYNFSSHSPSSRDLLLDSISDQILIDYSGSKNSGAGNNNNGRDLYNGYADLNGHVSGLSDL